MRRTLALSLVMMLAAAGNAFAGAEARMAGKVIDGATKQPIADAVVKWDAIEGKTIKGTIKTKGDGKFAVFVLDGSIRYKFNVSAPGYDTVEETLRLALGGTTDKNWELYKTGTKTVEAAPGATNVKVDPAVIAYNEGAGLANAKDYAGAIAKFQEAVTIKPELTAAWIALAKTQLRQKDYPKAIEAANKVLEIDDSDMEMISVLSEAYAATGDKAKAAQYSAKLPKNAGALYNDAAKKINSGDDAAAETLLKQAIAADEKMALAHYELGMIYVRAGKSPEARAALEKYLELDPKGPNAATAKEMMSYLK